MHGTGLRFGLPPSLGAASSRLVARELADALFRVGFDTVIPARSYPELERLIVAGEVDAAWGPPLVCARAERAGARVVFRGVRGGETSYRSVLIARRRDELALDGLEPPGAPFLRAAWVDPWSMGGYILPRHHLRERGVDLAQVFADERTLGSYEACFSALLDFEADLTASFANKRGYGFIEMCGPESRQLEVIGETRACPNDGLVVRPGATRPVIDRLRSAVGDPASMEALARCLDVDGFDEPPASTYAGLLALL